MAIAEEMILFWITCGCTLLFKLNRPHLWLFNSFSLNWYEIGYLTSDLIPNLLMKYWSVSHRLNLWFCLMGSQLWSSFNILRILAFFWILVDARSMLTKFLRLLRENSYELVSLFISLLKLGFNLGLGLLEEIILNRCKTLSWLTP
jgi:hypothetical protein